MRPNKALQRTWATGVIRLAISGCALLAAATPRLGAGWASRYHGCQAQAAERQAVRRACAWPSTPASVACRAGHGALGFAFGAGRGFRSASRARIGIGPGTSLLALRSIRSLRLRRRLR